MALHDQNPRNTCLWKQDKQRRRWCNYRSWTDPRTSPGRTAESPPTPASAGMVPRTPLYSRENHLKELGSGNWCHWSATKAMQQRFRDANLHGHLSFSFSLSTASPVLILTSAMDIAQVREAPHVAQTDGITGHCEEVVAFVRPFPPLLPGGLGVGGAVGGRSHGHARIPCARTWNYVWLI